MVSAGCNIESPIIQKLRSLASGPGILVIAALILPAICLLDITTPLGVPVWIFYLIPLSLSYWSGWRYAIPMVCIVTLLFVSAGFLLSPPGISGSEALFYRSFFSLIFIGYSIIFMLVRPSPVPAKMF
nr:hypothetical protein [uncultured Methanoregula sp.]